MSIRDSIWNTVKWKAMKAHLGYTDEEMKVFRQNPRNEDVLSNAPAFLKRPIVLEVAKSHGCNSQHKVGVTSSTLMALETSLRNVAQRRSARRSAVAGPRC